MNQQSIKKQQLLSFLLVMAIVVVVNILSSYVFTRIDLTEDKRFTLSSNTKELMKQLDDVVFFKIYLEGDLPPDFKRLRNEVEDKLAEMRIYSNGNLGYEFIDAAAIENEQQREALYKQLYQKGLMPTTLQLKENDASTQKIIFPGAIINSNNLEQAITFLQEQMGVDDAQMLNNSIRNLEYQITRPCAPSSRPWIPRGFSTPGRCSRWNCPHPWPGRSSTGRSARDQSARAGAGPTGHRRRCPRSCRRRGGRPIDAAQRKEGILLHPEAGYGVRAPAGRRRVADPRG